MKLTAVSEMSGSNGSMLNKCQLEYVEQNLRKHYTVAEKIHST